MSVNKPNIILDLDQTLISSEPNEELNFDNDSYKKKSKLFRSDDMDGFYTVFNRPHLQKFLDYLFENFNVTIWTAATKDYALFIVEHIILNNKPERNIDFIFFSYHCNLSKKTKNSSKDLSMLWDKYNLSGYTDANTVIIDDFKDEVHKCQPNNCIIAPPFEFTENGSENDTFLKDIIPHLDKMKKRIENREPDIAKNVNIKMKTLESKA